MQRVRSDMPGGREAMKCPDCWYEHAPGVCPAVKCPKCGSEMCGPNAVNDYYCPHCLICKRGYENKVK